ncbi:MAG: MFS transporter [Sulfolobales archaeon]
MSEKRSIWKILAVEIYIPSILLAVSRGVIITALPLYLLAEGYTYSMIGLLISSINMGALAVDFISGYMLYKLGFEKLNILSLALISSALTLTLLTYNDYYTLLTLLTLFGAGRSLWSMSRKYFISVHVPYEYRGRASSVIGASERIGLFAGPFIVGIVVLFGEYYHALMIAAIISISTLLTDLLYRSKHVERDNIYVDRDVRDNIESRSLVRDLATLFTFRFIMLYIALFLIQGVRSVRQVILPSIGVDLAGLESSTTSFVIGLAGALDVLMAYPAGYVMDKRGRVYAVSMSFSVISIAYVILSLSRDSITFLVGALVLGFGNGLGAGTMITMGTDIYSFLGDKRRAALFLTLWQLIGDIGTVATPAIAGVIATYTSITTACLIISILSLASVLIMNLFGKSIKDLI